MKKCIISIILALTACICINAQDLNGKGTMTEHSFSHKGIKYTYYLYTPQNLKPGAPLLMVFHGYGSRDIPSIKYGFNPVADKEGFVVCYPKGPKDHKGKEYWSVGYQFHIDNNLMRDDVGMAVKLVRHLQKSFNLSRYNVFATGHSNGGAMSHILSYKASDTFAAVASVSGHIMECTYRSLDTSKPSPLMEIHGTLDPLSRWNGDPFNNDGWGADIAIPLAVGLSAAAHKCTHEETEILPLRRNKVIAHRYLNGTNGNQVWFYEVVGGRHSWAEQDMDTASEIWKFFSMYMK